MSQLTEIENKLVQIINWMNEVISQSKTTDELPAQIVINLASLLRVSIGGVSQRITLQQIIDAAQNGLSGVQVWSPGTFTTQTAVIYGNAIYVLNNGVSMPFISSDFLTEVEANAWVIPAIPSTVNLVDGPNTKVFDLGNITAEVTDDDFVSYINTNGATYNLSDTSKTYFFRFIINNVDYLYAYNSDTGGFVNYGTGSGNTMLIGYLDLFYNTSVSSGGGSSTVTPRAYLELRIIEKGIYNGIPNTGGSVFPDNLQKGDFVAGRKDINTYWDRAMYIGNDPSDRENCYEQLSGGGPSIIP